MIHGKYRYRCAMISPSLIKKSAVAVKQRREKFCNPHTGIMTLAHTYIHTMTLNDDAPSSTSGYCTQSINSNKGYISIYISISIYTYTYVHIFPFFVEATGITERSPKRAAVSELKSFSDGISGRSSPREVSEMPVLTRVCSPATLPRLKKFRFHPIDGESCFLLLICNRIDKTEFINL